MTDPLNISIPIAGVESGIPLLPEGDYILQVAESAIVQSKSQPDGLNWRLKLCTTSPVVSVAGTQINPNFPLYHTIALQPSVAAHEKGDTEGFKRNIVEAVDALLGTNKDNRPDFSRALVDSVVGKTVLCTVIIDDYQGNKNNKIRRMKVGNV